MKTYQVKIGVYKIDCRITFHNREKYCIIFSDYYKMMPEFFHSEKDTIKRFNSIPRSMAFVVIDLEGNFLNLSCNKIVSGYQFNNSVTLLSETPKVKYRGVVTDRITGKVHKTMHYDAYAEAHYYAEVLGKKHCLPNNYNISVVTK